MSPHLDVVYRDDRLIAINKPAGLLVHRSRTDRTASVFAMQTLRNQIGQRVYPVHRLDKPTSGVLLFALDSEAARDVAAQFEDRSVRKTYHAVVRGYTDDQERIDYALTEARDRTEAAGEEARSAVTTYRTIAVREVSHPVGRYETARYSLVELIPETGRRHQLRRHMKHIFHPIIGDRKYGDRDHNTFFRDEWRIERMLLHASSLVAVTPDGDRRITIVAPVPADFMPALDRLGWNSPAASSAPE